jgi:hypothetical protein
MPAELIRGIEGHDVAAMAAIEALQDRCLVDDRNRTLFDVAILADNTEAIALLASDADALAFHAPVDEKLRDQVKHSVAMRGIELPISKLEDFLEDGFGKHLAYGRTPLLTACRAGNVDAMGTLLAAGARPGDKDIIGLTAAELAFFAHGEAGLRDFMGAFEQSGQTNLPVGRRLLEEALAFPETLELLLRVAKLDAAARRLWFCACCAWLDAEAVQAMLAEGYDPNKGVTADINPLREACTSVLLWNASIPGGLEVAYHYTKHHGHPEATVISFDNDLLNEDGSNFGKLFAEAERKRDALAESVEAMTIDPEAEHRLIERRMELLDILVGAGLDTGMALEKLGSDFLGELRRMGLGDVAVHLKRSGTAPPRKKAQPAATTSWELVGEAVLSVEYWPDEGPGGLIRLVLYDGYGPVDGLSLSAGLSRGRRGPTGEWRELKPVKETLGIDGERVPRAEVREPVYGETPWELSFELALDKSSDADTLWIRLDHAGDERLRGELDAWKFAKG